MKPLKWTARALHLLGAVGFALLLGCADKEATAPPSLKPRLNISQSGDLSATVTSDITLYDKGGKVRRYKHSQKVKASFLGGVAQATAVSSFFIDARVTLVADTVISTDGIVLTPVLALLAGQLALDYDSTTTDEYGNQVRLVGKGPPDGSPVNEVWGYVNGQLVSYKRSSWSAAEGGYLLTDQSLSGYSGGVVTGQVVSKVVSGSTILMTNNESVGARLAAFPEKALTKVACWLAPQSAYAAGVPCLYTGAVFAGATVGLGIATATVPLTGGLSVTAYLLGWAGWTDSMYNFLSCVNGRSRGGGTPLAPVKTK